MAARGDKKPAVKTPEQALSSLMMVCSRAEKCSADALRLMKKWGVEDAEAAKVLARLIREKFIDDSRYAESYVREKRNLTGWGPFKIRAMLARKAIPKPLVEAALADNFDERDTAERLAERLFRKYSRDREADPYKLKTKMLRYALSLGHSYETAGEIVEQALARMKDENE